ncbi:MAG: IPT/TIG domain-containing protein [Bryobacteraceae bacterium]
MSIRLLRFLILTLVAASTAVEAQTVTALPVALTFNYQAGNALPTAQTVAVKISAGTPAYTVAVTGTNTLWLTVTPDTGKLPATLSARANPTTLAVGQYLATIVITVTGAGSPISIPVTLNVSAPLPALTLSASTLSFAAPPAAPAAQTVRLSTSVSPLSFTAAVASAPWVSISPAGGILVPGAQLPLTVTVDPSSLNPQAAPYTAKITISAPGATTVSKTQTITVSLTVSAVTPALVSIWPSSIPLNASATTITIRGTNFYSASVAKITGVATPLATKLLGNDALEAVIPATLLNTATTLNVVVGNPAPGGDSTSLPLTVGAASVIQAVVNTASLLPGDVSPGELITLFGADIGPGTPGILTDADSDGFADTSLGTMTATVDGIAAPLVYVSQNQITLQVPYEVTQGAGKVLSLTKGASPAITTTVMISPTAPGIFCINGSGTGPMAALNFNATSGMYTVNTSANAAKVGDTIVIFATGEGDYATAISPRTGLIFPPTAPPLPQVNPLPIVNIGGAAATVSYAGPSVGTLLGVVQLNVVVPAGTTLGAAVPVSITIGGVASQAGATIAVK